MVWDLRLIGDPGGPTSITGTARFMTTTFYIVITLLSGRTAESAFRDSRRSDQGFYHLVGAPACALRAGPSRTVNGPSPSGAQP
ncbi:MAG: hypothetical protein QOJ44_2329, partial [Acidimicrobiaceae bacterium]|nr:hypothetical protein [Acidimicrobiaceae bacterium]